MRRLTATALISLALFAQTACALAGRPVFVVVPDHSRGGSMSLEAAIHRQISGDRRAVIGVHRQQRVLALRLHGLEANLRQAADPFEYEDAIVKLERALEATRSRAATLKTMIRRLRAALEPVKLSVSSPQGPSLAAGWNAVAIAEHYLGVRYLWGGNNPSDGFDCSGFVTIVYARLGLALPHYAASQYARTPRVDPNRLQAGDLLFFEPHADGPGHVGIYVGDGMLIEAPHSGDVVKLAPVESLSAALGFVGATRPALLRGLSSPGQATVLLGGAGS